MVLFAWFKDIHEVREALDAVKDKAIVLELDVKPFYGTGILVDIWTPKKSLPNSGFKAIPNPLLKKAFEAAVDRLNEKTEDNLQAVWKNREAVIEAYKRGAFRQ